MAKKPKFYCVWVGREPGVYDDWSDCEEQVLNFPGARYKAFSSPQEATAAFRRGSAEASPSELGDLLISAEENGRTEPEPPAYTRIAAVDKTAWAVDASCQGNPGIMEYRGVDLATGQQIFKVGPFREGTNNIGEFLAIVHALAEMEKRGERHAVYTDSKTALAWIRNRQVKTQLKPSEANRKIFELLGRALAWVRTHSWDVKILKWQTELWGEIPADFGRK